MCIDEILQDKSQALVWVCCFQRVPLILRKKILKAAYSWVRCQVPACAPRHLHKRQHSLRAGAQREGTQLFLGAGLWTLAKRNPKSKEDYENTNSHKVC